MNDKLNNVTILPPFKKFCMTIGELPSSYLESMTYYESLLWLTKYLGDTVIPALNANGEAVIELQEKYIELKNYVDNYFENLDVQEEINNKLDEMADSGELVAIISAYLALANIFGYDTIADLAAAENLTDGLLCYVAGQSSYDDGKQGYYKIREITESDTVDGFNIVSITNSDNLIGERLPNYYINELSSAIDTLNNTTIPNVESEITDVTTDFNNNKTSKLNLMNYIMYDFDNTATYYIQGLAVNGNDMYVYKEYSDSNGKLMKFNLSSNTYTSEASVDLKHGNDMTVINNILYSANADGTKKITAYNLTNINSNEITLNIDESQVACITKEDDNNLLLIANSGYGSNFSGCAIYRYNLSTSTLTKLTTTNDIYVNYYATQSMVYLKGYIYLLVSSPNQVIKIKIDGNNASFETIYSIPDYDNIGLKIGELEGIDLAPTFGENAIMITSQIYDCAEVGRTMKSYIINPINNVPDKLVHYPDISYSEYLESVDRVYVDNGSSLIELGTQNYPFHTLNRALDCVRNLKDKYVILLYNSASQLPYNLYVGSIENVRCAINTVNNNIQINWQRILNSDIVFSGSEVTLKNKVYSQGWQYGNIVNSKIIFDTVHFDVNDLINIYKSDIKFYGTTGTVNTYDGNYVFRCRLNSTIMDGINWSTWTLNSKKPYQLYGVGMLYKISDVNLNSSDQSSWVTNNVDFNASTAYSIIFNGTHTCD